ncbi:MAG: hypothetical protein RSD29_02815 [Bacilli bacterium]
MENISTNVIENKMNEIMKILDSGCDLKYLENNMPFILDVGNIFEKISKINNAQSAVKYYAFLVKYLLIYMAKKYEKKLNYYLYSKNIDSSCYSVKDNTIYFAEDFLFRKQPTFACLCFVVFHEFKHKMQCDDMTSGLNNIIRIDPATILFFKSQVMLLNSQLYKTNHDLYYGESDANLFAVREMEIILSSKAIKETDTGLTDNYPLYLLSNNADLSTEEYNDKQDLPIIYKIDCEYKKFVRDKTIAKESLLNLIYKQGGIPKTYEELLEEKKNLMEKHKNERIKRKTSTTDYSLQEVSAEKQIHEIYRLIVASDPILTIQEKFYNYNHISEKLIRKTLIKKIINLLENVPQLIEIYWEEITNILSGEIAKGNVDVVLELIGSLSNEKLKEFIKTSIKNLTNYGKKGDSSEEGMFTEEELGKETTFSNVYRPNISKHEKEELTKNRECMINMVEKEKRKELEQQIENQEEEDFGMTR